MVQQLPYDQNWPRYCISNVSELQKSFISPCFSNRTSTFFVFFCFHLDSVVSIGKIVCLRSILCTGRSYSTARTPTTGSPSNYLPDFHNYLFRVYVIRSHENDLTFSTRLRTFSPGPPSPRPRSPFTRTAPSKRPIVVSPRVLNRSLRCFGFRDGGLFKYRKKFALDRYWHAFRK